MREAGPGPPAVLVDQGRVLHSGENVGRDHLVIARGAEVRAVLLTVILLLYIFLMIIKATHRKFIIYRRCLFTILAEPPSSF